MNNQLKYFLLNGYQEYNQMVMTGGVSPSGATPRGTPRGTPGNNDNAPEYKEKMEKLAHIKQLETKGTRETLRQITQYLSDPKNRDNDYTVGGDVFSPSQDFVYYAPIDEDDFINLKKSNPFSGITEKGQKLGQLLNYNSGHQNMDMTRYPQKDVFGSTNYLYFSNLPNQYKSLEYKDAAKNIKLLKLET